LGRKKFLAFQKFDMYRCFS